MSAAAHPFIDPVKTVLWVDSDTKDYVPFSTFLERTGRFRLMFQSEEAAALEALGANPRVDLILSDHRYITGGGALGKGALRMSIPIVIITNTFTEAVNALRLYAMKIPVVKKPIAEEKLLALIDHILNGRPLPASPVLSAWWGDET